LKEVVMKSKRKNTRNRILAASRVVFAEQGYAGTTLSEVARAAGISEATIYEYFKGKEELFLAIPVNEIETAFQEHDVQSLLFGVKGALNRLRKFVWAFLQHIIENRTSGRIIFLHLKTSKAFTESAAFKEVQKFYGNITEIIEHGQESGEIRADIRPHNARTLIVGAIDNLITRWFLKDCSYDLWPSIEEVYNLIEDGLRVRPTIHIHVSYEPAEEIYHERNRRPFARSRRSSKKTKAME
jgi:TetR/AcrR family fatty acid metabolism transcriptional regulator